MLIEWFVDFWRLNESFSPQIPFPKPAQSLANSPKRRFTRCRRGVETYTAKRPQHTGIVIHTHRILSIRLGLACANRYKVVLFSSMPPKGCLLDLEEKRDAVPSLCSDIVIPRLGGDTLLSSKTHSEVSLSPSPAESVELCADAGASQHGVATSAPLVLTHIERIRRPHAPRLDSSNAGSRSTNPKTTISASYIQSHMLFILEEARIPLNAEALLEGLWSRWYADHVGGLKGPSTQCRSLPPFPLTEEDVLNHLTLLRAKGVVKSFKGGTFHHIASLPRAVIIANLLVSPEYQRLGLEAWTVAGSSFHIVPPTAEHRFLCFRNSSIPGANLGLFLRPYRMLRAGTIVCEYKGRAMKRIVHQSSHAVRLQSGLILDGLDGEGNLISFAPLMNDNGPAAYNVKLTEFDEFPERVFVAATRDLFGGEELFVEYGANYWGKKSYADVPVAIKHVESDAPATGKRRVERADVLSPVSLLHPFREERNCTRCRECSSFVPKRVMALHTLGCQDPLTMFVPREIDPLPFNFFTTAAHSHSSQQLRRNLVANNIGHTTVPPASFSTSFVHSTPLTFSLTHEIFNPTELDISGNFAN